MPVGLTQAVRYSAVETIEVLADRQALRYVAIGGGLSQEVRTSYLF